MQSYFNEIAKGSIERAVKLKTAYDRGRVASKLLDIHEQPTFAQQRALENRLEFHNDRVGTASEVIQISKNNLVSREVFGRPEVQRDLEFLFDELESTGQYEIAKELRETSIFDKDTSFSADNFLDSNNIEELRRLKVRFLLARKWLRQRNHVGDKDLVKWLENLIDQKVTTLSLLHELLDSFEAVIDKRNGKDGILTKKEKAVIESKIERRKYNDKSGELIELTLDKLSSSGVDVSLNSRKAREVLGFISKIKKVLKQSNEFEQRLLEDILYLKLDPETSSLFTFDNVLLMISSFDGSKKLKNKFSEYINYLADLKRGNVKFISNHVEGLLEDLAIGVGPKGSFSEIELAMRFFTSSNYYLHGVSYTETFGQHLIPQIAGARTEIDFIVSPLDGNGEILAYYIVEVKSSIGALERKLDGVIYNGSNVLKNNQIVRLSEIVNKFSEELDKPVKGIVLVNTKDVDFGKVENILFDIESLEPRFNTPVLLSANNLTVAKGNLKIDSPFLPLEAGFSQSHEISSFSASHIKETIEFESNELQDLRKQLLREQNRISLFRRKKQDLVSSLQEQIEAKRLSLAKLNLKMQLINLNNRPLIGSLASLELGQNLLVTRDNFEEIFGTKLKLKQPSEFQAIIERVESVDGTRFKISNLSIRDFPYINDEKVLVEAEFTPDDALSFGNTRVSIKQSAQIEYRITPDGNFETDTMELKISTNEKGELIVEDEGYVKDSAGLKFISDQEIIQVLDRVDRDKSAYQEITVDELVNVAEGSYVVGDLEQTVVVKQFSDGRKTHLLQQKGMRSCGQTTACMMGLDLLSAHGELNQGKLELVERYFSRILSHGNLSIKKAQKEYLEMFSSNITGVNVESNKIQNNFSEYKSLIDQYGPAIVGISGEVGAHVIIIDQIIGNEEQSAVALIRDPLHGWQIFVPFSAIKSRNGGLIDVLQFNSPNNEIYNLSFDQSSGR